MSRHGGPFPLHQSKHILVAHLGADPAQTTGPGHLVTMSYLISPRSENSF
jgi:hypothetical protein